MRIEAEDLFRPGKWFVIFCAVLVAVWGALQLVAGMRLEEEARQAAERVFDWTWPGRNWGSSARITGASVVHRTDTDAIVMVKGVQKVLCPESAGAGQEAARDQEKNDCSVTLTFYRLNNRWELGKVELP